LKRAETIRILSEQYPALKKQYNLTSLRIFGSVARDEARPDSDIDLLIEFSDIPGLLEFIELQQSLEMLLGCKVDLATPRSLKSRTADEFLKDAVTIT
jgi:uncharacterized protein